MKITYDIPKPAKKKLQKLKETLRDEDLPAFERHIVAALIEKADIEVLRAHFVRVVARKKRRSKSSGRRKP